MAPAKTELMNFLNTVKFLFNFKSIQDNTCMYEKIHKKLEISVIQSFKNHGSNENCCRFRNRSDLKCT